EVELAEEDFARYQTPETHGRFCRFGGYQLPFRRSTSAYRAITASAPAAARRMLRSRLLSPAATAGGGAGRSVSLPARRLGLVVNGISSASCTRGGTESSSVS